jgi:DNA ligase-associated metallophosphoesterase
VEIEVAGESLVLLPEKAIFWKRNSALFLSDLHLAKDGHFRRNGFAVPANLSGATLQRLTSLVEKWHPRTIYFLGDLFHSEYNNKVELLHDWHKQHSDIKMVLISGNHDVLDTSVYAALQLEVVADTLHLPPFELVHEPPEQPLPGRYYLCGHIHPAFRLAGKGRQSLRLPCFWMGQQVGVLPAFGTFTGSKVIQANKPDRVFVVAEDQVVRVQ